MTSTLFYTLFNDADPIKHSLEIRQATRRLNWGAARSGGSVIRSHRITHDRTTHDEKLYSFNP